MRSRKSSGRKTIRERAKSGSTSSAMRSAEYDFPEPVGPTHMQMALRFRFRTRSRIWETIHASLSKPLSPATTKESMSEKTEPFTLERGAVLWLRVFRSDVVPVHYEPRLRVFLFFAVGEVLLVQGTPIELEPFVLIRGKKVLEVHQRIGPRHRAERRGKDRDDSRRRERIVIDAAPGLLTGSRAR